VRILVTGAAGQLGTDVVTHFGAMGDELLAFDRKGLDISDRSAVTDIIAASRPDVIVNCAAWTAVDDCESDPGRAELINGTAVGFLADAAADHDAHLVQISTDYVFDGTKVGAYTETDIPSPQSAYGRSKLAGERAAGPSATVVRTSWVCSAHGGNMVATILRLADQHPTLRFVSDQRGNPSFTADLAPVLRRLAFDRVEGIVHVTNAGTVSWFEFARAVLVAAGLDPDRVEPIATADLKPPRPAPRPANSALANDRLRALGYPPLRDFRSALADVVPAYLD
jgi:dTDP-4-dehydrorhamnose reductase